MQTAITGSEVGGCTPSEKYLAGLCEKAFLSLWAYPNVYTDEGRPQGKGAGKELCDLLVVFGEEIIIFSDKHCEYKETGDDLVDWGRWYRRGVQKSVNQLIGAASFIKRFPGRLFRDPRCSVPFPREVPRSDKFNVHLVAVTRGSREACERYFAGQSIGSLRFNGDLAGDSVPFTIGPIKTSHGLVHVFDEHTLDVLFSELDTVTDFVEYLRKRATVLQRAAPVIVADGEEQLLARYLKNMVNGEHDFAIETEIDGEQLSAVYVSEGEWEAFVENQQYLSKKRADAVSYRWDELIERFARRGRKDLVAIPEFVRTGEPEQAIREMAVESRFARRVLAHTLSNFAQTLIPGSGKTRVILSPSSDEKAYVFLAAPFQPSNFSSYEDYRQQRVSHLAAYVAVARTRFQRAKYVIGIAFDSHSEGRRGGSEDLYCHYVPEVTEDVLQDARRVQVELGLLQSKSVVEMRYSAREYPDVPSVTSTAEAKLSRQQRRAAERAAVKAARRER